MYECVLAKFSQNLDIQKALLDTEDATLVEHTTNGTLYPFRQVSCTLEPFLPISRIQTGIGAMGAMVQAKTCLGRL